MPKTHTVAQGEHLPGIAAQYGFADYTPIWDDPQNADLKDKRKNPNILFPGDQVIIPDRELREEDAATDQHHPFTATIRKLKLRVKVLDLNNEPIHRTCFLKTAGDVTIMIQNDDIYEADVHPLDKTGTMGFPQSPTEPSLRDDIDLEIGGLDPIDKPSGQQERLNNLGYFAGFSQTPDPQQFKWAVEEFQCDHKKSDGLKVTGICDPEKTQKVLEKEHGC